MAVFRPFRALRPVPDKAAAVAALPYDVMSSDEARKMAEGNPLSFLHVDKAEIDLPAGVGLYDDRVYETAATNLKKLSRDGVLIRDEKPCYYIYRETMGERSQAGIVGCASIDDYGQGVIKKHELTVAEKEADRIRHVDVCDANTGIIFLAFRDSDAVASVMADVMGNGEADTDFVSEDGVRHQVWVISDDAMIGALSAAFEGIPALYIADGHHRTASAARVGVMRREAHPDYTGEEEFNFFLAAAFPESELAIWDYNRVVSDLGGLTEEAFLEKLGEVFEIVPFPDSAALDPEAVKPGEAHTFSMYLKGRWYSLRLDPGTIETGDPVKRLDVSILQDRVLTPILGIGDPRTDGRISFVGGIRGIGELKRLVDGGAKAAFALYPTSMDDLMSIADAGSIMPPKSTWFEPKLRSGLFIHELS